MQHISFDLILHIHAHEYASVLGMHRLIGWWPELADFHVIGHDWQPTQESELCRFYASLNALAHRVISTVQHQHHVHACVVE